MTRILARLTAILTIFSGPASHPYQPDQPSIRDGFQCLFCFEQLDPPVGEMASATPTSAAIGKPGFSQRQALRGICLLQCLPVGGQPVDSAPATVTCPLESLCGGTEPCVVDRTVRGLTDWASRGTRWLNAGVDRVMRSTAFPDRRFLDDVLLLIPVFTNPVSTAAETSQPSGRPLPHGSAASYWDYYGDCDRWGLVFSRLETTAAAQRPCDRIVSHPGQVPSMLVAGARQTVERAGEVFASIVDQVVSCGDHAGAWLTEVARFRAWHLQHVQPLLLRID